MHTFKQVRPHPLPTTIAVGPTHARRPAIGCHAVAVVSLVSMALLSMATCLPAQPGDAGVAAGKIIGPKAWNHSKIYPGTERDYWIYVPAQYEKQKPACVLVVQDGLNRARGWKLTEVMDRLIASGEMPVTIGVFINPGVVPPASDQAQPRFNRSFEYDSLGDRYARFLIEEILPEVAGQFSISDDPNDRAIAGASSGGICAFTVAWERPDAFRRVLSTIGTFVGLRGGDAYPILVRKMEPKPIRVFLQDGRNDLNIYGGDWWMANQRLERALRWAGYDVQHAWGDGGHDSRQAAEVMPDALKWLWRDHPQPIATPTTPHRRTDILLAGEGWQLVSQGHQFTEGPAVDKAGRVYFTDVPRGEIYRVELDGTVQRFVTNSPGVNGLMFGPDGYLYACQNGNRQIVRYDPQGNEEVVVGDAPSNDLVVLPRGGYYSDPSNKRIWHVNQQGERTVVDEGIAFPNGLVTSPDGAWLHVADTRGRFIYNFRVQADGSLALKQRYGYLHLSDDGSDSGADGMTVDDQGRLYVASRLGVQVLDQLGRVHLILAKPQDKWLSNVVFGGPNRDTLFVTCSDKVYKRRVNARGVVPWEHPQQPPKPKL